MSGMGTEAGISVSKDPLGTQYKVAIFASLLIAIIALIIAILGLGKLDEDELEKTMDEKDDVLKTAYDAQIGALESELESSKKGSLNANAVRVAMVVHGHDVDAFWTDLVKPGFDTAVKDMHVFGEWLTPFHDTQLEDWNDMGTHIKNSAYQMYDGIATSIPDPDHAGLKGGIEAALNEPVPVISINSGLEAYQNFESSDKQYHIKTHVGQDEAAAGKFAGEQMAIAGATNVACIIPEVNNDALTIRCDNYCMGFRKQLDDDSAPCVSTEFGWTTVDVEQVVKDFLTDGNGKDANGLLVVAPQAVDNVAKAVASIDRTIKLATFDHTDKVLQLLIDGEMEFAIDQCPFSQGYLPVVALTLNAEIGTMLGAKGSGPGAPIYSGPSPIFKEDAVLKQNMNFADMSTAAKQRGDIYICVISHGHGTRETFWATVMRGVRQGGLDLGVGRVEFHHPSRKSQGDYSWNIDDIKALMEECKDADALAVTITNQEVADAIVDVCKTKPCVTINSGMFQGLEAGSFTHFGMEEFTAGAMSAQKFVDLGATEMHCLLYDDVNQAIVDRCAGAEAMFTCTSDDSLNYDKYDDMRALTCTEDRSGSHTASADAMLLGNIVCTEARSEWKCTDDDTDAVSLTCPAGADNCCQCASGDDTKVVFADEHYPSALLKWYQSMPSDAAVYLPGSNTAQHFIGAVGADLSANTQVGSVDCSFFTLNHIVSGDIDFCVDQQPFLQGYLPVVYLTNAIQWREKAGGGQPSVTGPAIVTVKEAPMALLYAEQGYR